MTVAMPAVRTALASVALVSARHVVWRPAQAEAAAAAAAAVAGTAGTAAEAKEAAVAARGVAAARQAAADLAQWEEDGWRGQIKVRTSFTLLSP